MTSHAGGVDSWLERCFQVRQGAQSLCWRCGGKAVYPSNLSPLKALASMHIDGIDCIESYQREKRVSRSAFCDTRKIVVSCAVGSVIERRHSGASVADSLAFASNSRRCAKV